MGWVVGGITGLVLWAALLLFPAPVAVLLSMALSVLLTGAFHEDGFIDACDGFGGGWKPEQVLTIMKDSRIGAYGGIGMVLMLMLKWQLLTTFALHTTACLPIMLMSVGAHSVSRLAASGVAQFLPYVQDIDKSKVRPIAAEPLAPSAVVFSIVLGLLPAVGWPVFQGYYWVAALASVLAAWPMAWYFRRRIGGYTGDCLGATQQVAELCFYLSLVALWK